MHDHNPRQTRPTTPHAEDSLKAWQLVSRTTTGVSNTFIAAQLKLAKKALSSTEIALPNADASQWHFMSGIGTSTVLRLNRSQRLIEIAENIVHIFDANGDTHHAVGYADFAADCFADTGMRHGCGMGDQSFDAT